MSLISKAETFVPTRKYWLTLGDVGSVVINNKVYIIKILPL